MYDLIMEYELDNIELLAGINLTSAKEGEMVEVQQRGFFTPKNFDKYYNLLNVIGDYYLHPYLKEYSPTSIENFLIFINKKKKTAKIYINEPLNMVAQCISKTSIDKGQNISKSKIAGITTLKIKDIPFDNSNGIIFYFTQGWKTGLYFDLSPINNDTTEIKDIEYQLGQAYQMLLFDEYENFNKINKDAFYGTGWFPFIAIQGDLTESLINEFLQERSVETSESKIIDYFSKSENLNKLMVNYNDNDYLKPHIIFIERGIERFLAEDWVSCINNVWPRIEGILRYLYNKKGRFTQTSCLESLKEILLNDNIVPEIYFPESFKEYMLNFYFKDFNFETKELDLSRHTIGHGVSTEHDYNRKNCILAFLVINQLYYYSKFTK